MVVQYYAKNKDGKYLCEKDHEMFLSDNADDLYVCANERRIIGHIKAMGLDIADFEISQYGGGKMNKSIKESVSYFPDNDFVKTAEKIINGGDRPCATLNRHGNSFALYYVGDSNGLERPVYVVTQNIGGIETILGFQVANSGEETSDILANAVKYDFLGTEAGKYAGEPVGMYNDVMEYVSNVILKKKDTPVRKIKYKGNYYLLYYDEGTEANIIMQVMGKELRYIGYFLGAEGWNDDESIKQFINTNKRDVATDAGLYENPELLSDAGIGIEPVTNPRVDYNALARERNAKKAVDKGGDKQYKQNRVVSVKDWVKHFQGIVGGSDKTSELESLYDKDIILSLDGYEIHIPFGAESYNAIYDFLEDLMINRQVFDESKKQTPKENKPKKERVYKESTTAPQETHRTQLEDGTPVIVVATSKPTRDGRREVVDLTIGDKVVKGVDSWEGNPCYKYEYENALRQAVEIAGYDQDVIDITCIANDLGEAVAVLANYISNL